MTSWEQLLERARPQASPLRDEMEQYARDFHVPIMDVEGIETLKTLLRLQQPKRLLEIGSAIGYSALQIAEALPDVHITTIERDDERYERARAFIERSDANDRITVHHADALAFELSSDERFDALFIDAAKGQYRRFFEKYEPYVQPGGIIYCDNMFMHGELFTPLEDIKRRRRTMIRNLKQFVDWLIAHESYDVSFLNVGDGIVVAQKKDEK